MPKPSRLFQLIDFDRTIFDTARFAALLTDEINIIQPGLGDELETQFEEAYKKEETFFMLRYLRNRLGDEHFERIVQSIVDREGKESFLLPGVAERLAYADEISSLRPSWGILTYGDAIDQRMKLRISGFEDAPVHIAGTPDKGALITSWLNSDGTFTLPGELTSETVTDIIFEDDKLRAFHGIPERVQGFWITAADDAMVRVREVSGAVVPVKNLGETVVYLKAHS
jgi:hypothetical protein